MLFVCEGHILFCVFVCEGVPLPSQEQNAIDGVMQYAIQSLHFPPDQIVLFAWSIGGYAATWAAMQYPDVKHVVSSLTVSF